MRLIKKYDLQFFLGGSIIVALLLITIDDAREVGINLFTEITGVAMTVFIINKILERKERQKRISIDQRILREVQFIIASYFSIWKHLVWQYLPKENIVSEKDLLNNYAKLVKLSCMSDHFNVVSIQHPESWKLFFYKRSIKECFENYYAVLNKDIQSLIDDFKLYLEPELLDSLLNIMEGSYFKNIGMMHLEETTNVLTELGQDTNKLESYIGPHELDHIHQFIELMKYSSNLKSTINKFKKVNVELYQINNYFSNPILSP